MRQFEDDEEDEIEEVTETDEDDDVEPATAASAEPVDGEVVDDPWASEETPDVALAVDESASDDTSVPVARSTRWVPLGDLRLEYGCWRNPREFTGLSADDIDTLASSILARTTTTQDTTYAGIKDPLEVVQVAVNGDIINLVIDGQRRHKAATKAYRGDETVLIPVVDLEEEPIAKLTPELANKYLRTALEMVGTRAGLSSYELSESAMKLRGTKDESTGKEFTLATIATVVGRSESWVSKILKAREAAKPTLLNQWKKGEITDEQFKDLATVKTPAAQAKAAEAVVEARKSGDKAASRTIAKEQKEIVKAKATAKAAKAKGPVVQGEQTEIPMPPPRKAVPFAVIEDLLDQAKRNPPTHEYVKGIMDGVRYANGLVDPAKFSAPWHTYLDHVSGKSAALKKSGKKSGKKK